MEEKIVPLTDADYNYIKKRQRTFINECFKRYIGIGVMLLFLFSLRFLVEAFQDVDFTAFYWVFVVVVLVFTFINVFLFRKFYSTSLFKNKKVMAGIISEKGYSHAKKGTFQFEVDKEKKLLKFNFVHKLGVANGITWVWLRYDKKSFDGSIPMGEFLYFIMDGEKINVDVSHFANFDAGEKIQIEKLAETDELIRISSLDHPEKSIELNTHKFFITRDGIKAMG